MVLNVNKKHSAYKEVQRYTLANPRSCSLGVITHKNLEWIEYSVRIVDMSILGIGVESNQQIPSGLVWFKKRVGGHKCGALRWSTQRNFHFRAGIEFMDLSRDMEEYLQQQIKQSQPHQPITDPEQIITTLLDAVNK